MNRVAPIHRPPSPAIRLAALAFLAGSVPVALAQQAPAPTPAPAAATAAPAFAAAPAPATLEPFVASYDAYYKGDAAGNATMRVTHNGAQWRVDLGISANRGIASFARLNIEQSTVFDTQGTVYRPLSQSTVRKAIFMGKKVTGTYDWASGVAVWTGDLKKDRLQPVPIRAGDMSALLINLAVVRDAQPGKTLHYRFVDGGRVRDHEYRVADAMENVKVGDLSYDAMRVSRVNGGNDETILWVVYGVPTPVRILQRDNGADEIDLRLTEYQGA